MIIIDNKKDYYDYLVGINGIDSHVVYDRRNSTRLDSVYKCSFYSFIPFPQYNDTVRKNQVTYKQKGKKYHYEKVNELVGKIDYFCLEIGFSQYGFKVERYLDDADHKIVHIVPTLVFSKKGEKNRLSKDTSPINLYLCMHGFYDYCGNLSIKVDESSIINNPILSSTFFPGFIDANEVYDEVYNYILSTKEKEIKGGRTDKQKAESHGFDKNSFRKVK